MLRSNSDVIAEYSDFDELKRMRQAYLVHTLDHVIQERRQVFVNDCGLKRQEEAEKGQQVTLENVFELQGKIDDDDKKNSDDESKEEKEFIPKINAKIEETPFFKPVTEQKQFDPENVRD